MDLLNGREQFLRLRLADFSGRLSKQKGIPSLIRTNAHHLLSDLLIIIDAYRRDIDMPPHMRGIRGGRKTLRKNKRKTRSTRKKRTKKTKKNGRKGKNRRTRRTKS